MTDEYRRTAFEVDGTFYAVPISFTDFDKGGNPIIAEEGWVELETDEEQAYRALALRLLRDEWETPISTFRDTELAMGNKEWLVMTDLEADEEWDLRLARRADGLDISPYSLRDFINWKAWTESEKQEGRGAMLARFDGLEVAFDTDFGTFFIYRQT